MIKSPFVCAYVQGKKHSDSLNEAHAVCVHTFSGIIIFIAVTIQGVENSIL